MNFARIGAVSAFLAVALGAFGAHLLRDSLGAALSPAWETGVRYQMFHALALIALDLLRHRVALGPTGARGIDALTVAGILFVAGTVLFSGSLYALALTGVRAWGAVTPFGGLAFLIGWIALAIGCRLPARAHTA